MSASSGSGATTIAGASRVSPGAPASATSKSTAVTLSSPPWSFAAVISACVACAQVVAVPQHELGDALGVDHRRQAVGAEQEDVARLRRDRERVDVDVRVGAERARDHGALRVHLGLGRGELAAPHELGDERVVVGELLEPAVAEAVGARVADVADRDRAVLLAEERDRHRRAHARGRGVVERALVDAAVRLLDSSFTWSPRRPARGRAAP